MDRALSDVTAIHATLRASLDLLGVHSAAQQLKLAQSQAATSELYDPTTQTWTNSGALNLGREFHTATALTDGSVMVTGGQTANRLPLRTPYFSIASRTGRGCEARAKVAR